MKPSRFGVLLGLALAIGLGTWLLLQFTYTTLPPLPWSAVPTLLLLAIGEAFTGYNIRARINRKPGADRKPGGKADLKPIEPLVVARMAALAKASAHAAAALAGFFGGCAIYLSSSLDKPTPRHDFIVSGGTFLSAAGLVGAALFLEWACRVPKDPENDHPHRAGA